MGGGPGAGTWIASIVHLSDLHLYVDGEGNLREPELAEAWIRPLLRPVDWLDAIGRRVEHEKLRWAQEAYKHHVLNALGMHEPLALQALEEFLPELIDRERETAIDDGKPHLPIVVAH